MQTTGDEYQKEVDYLVRYAEMSPVYFTPVWDAAETIAGEGSSEAATQDAALAIIADMLERGVKVGDMSPRDGEGVIPWPLSREESLRRIREEMKRYDDPLEYVNICWFSID
ncbi:hypothetical protein ACIRF8_31650 [Streptomyces sp. NPDC102406]|uniref:hypothetical protein n=1 Tax=Streptomyces sp. NPDC102406 TaxID=3366171 RepID=UPI003819410E